MKLRLESLCAFVGVFLLGASYAWNDYVLAIAAVLFLVAWLLIGHGDRRERGS